MSAIALERLVGQIQSLPAGSAELGLPRATVNDRGEATALPPETLRTRGAALLRALAEKVATALPAAIANTQQAWDQADAFALLDPELRTFAADLRRAAAAGVDAEDPLAQTAALETRLMIDSAIGLVTLIERRFAALMRLRLRSETPELLVDGEPFIDVASALSEAARRWR
jgi:hypothetical protein